MYLVHRGPPRPHTHTCVNVVCCLDDSVERAHLSSTATALFYLMLGLLQIPTGPQRKPQTMADLRLVLSPRQLLGEPQACQRGEEVEKREESKNYSAQGAS